MASHFHVEPVGTPRLGISACLLGDPVRFDGGHKRDAFLLDTLGRFVGWVPVCPELEAGLGVPRPALRLQKSGGVIRLIELRGGRDRTAELETAIVRRIDALDGERLDGFVLKKDSPSCGVERVRIYNEVGMPQKCGRGLFAAALTERFPLLPVEEEGRLRDPALRENFLERVFAWQRLRQVFAATWSVGDLVAFHTAHKLLLMAHDPPAYATLGRLVAGSGSLPRTALADAYRSMFMRALAVPATPRRHVNVLQHMLGYFKRLLDRDSRAELLGIVQRFAAGVVPLAVPLTLFAHHIRRCGVDYLGAQIYLRPYPEDLMVRRG